MRLDCKTHPFLQGDLPGKSPQEPWLDTWTDVSRCDLVHRARVCPLRDGCSGRDLELVMTCPFRIVINL
jgi:hypothetical protein